MPTKPKDINILITPEHTLLGDEIIHPATITVVLENGHSYDLDSILAQLDKLDKKQRAKWVPFKRIRRFAKAVKIALNETEFDKQR